jgi:hypothetical protein
MARGQSGALLGRRLAVAGFALVIVGPTILLVVNVVLGGSAVPA